MSLTTFKNRKWQRQRNDNDAYLEDLNQIVDQVNALPGTSTVLGYFATLADLITAYPAGANGQFGIVGNTIYIWDPITSAWITIGDTLYKGVLDASADIPYPTAQVGEFWFISVAGHIGSKQVEVGDQVICIEAYAGGMDDTKFMIVQTNVQVTSVTYNQLRALINNAGLEPGRQYLISDYVTAFNLFDGGTNTVVESTTGSQEPLLVKAVTTSTLDRVAQSWLYPQDIIYYHPYAKAVDRAAFIAAGDVGYIDGGDVVPNFKGVIEFRHDTKQNVSTWYDFRNIKFRRWAVDAVAYNGATAYVAKDVCKSGVDGKIYKCLTATTGEGDPTVNTADWILWLDIVSDAYVSWTSDKTKFNIYDINTANLIFVPATYQDVYTFGSWYNHVNDVTIGHNNLTFLINYGYNTTLNNIVFKTTDDPYTCYSNEIGEVSYNNTIGNNFYYNTIGNGFSSNTIGNGFSYNIIGNDFLRNIIGNDFYSNNIGNNSSTNTIGNNFSSNTIGNDVYYNTIGYGFSSNTIGNNSKVSAGINCKGNSIGDYNAQVTLGDNCTGISIGEKNGIITLDHDCNGISIGHTNTLISIGHSSSGLVIGNNNTNVTAGYGFIDSNVGSSNTIILGITCVNISIGNGSKITLGDNCTKLTFRNGCTFTGNTAATGLSRVTFEDAVKITSTDFTSSVHVKAQYNCTVFINATAGAPVVKLSYINTSNVFTVANVNA